MPNLKDLEPERLIRLNEEQRAIVLQRMKKAEERSYLLDKLKATNEPDVHQHIFDLFRDTDSDECEHERSIWSSCAECHEIDRLLFPEHYANNGDLIEEDERRRPETD